MERFMRHPAFLPQKWFPRLTEVGLRGAGVGQSNTASRKPNLAHSRQANQTSRLRPCHFQTEAARPQKITDNNW